MGMAGPTSGHFIGHQALIHHLRAAAAFALDSARFEGQLDLVFIGAPAVYQDTAEEALSCLVPIKNIHCEGDSRTAFTAALGGQPGIVILAGTGSFARGVNKRGETLTLGGWGTLLGDEGSAYDIGVQALRLAVRSSEGRAPKTALVDLLKERFRISRVRELTRIVYRDDFTREQIASLAPLVTAAARSGDEPARRLLYEAGRQLGQLACAVLTQLGMEDDDVPIVLTGGVQAAGDLILEGIAAEVMPVCPGATLRSPRYDPAVGAILLALEADGIAVTEEIKANLDRQLTETGERVGVPRYVRQLWSDEQARGGWS